MPTISGPNSGSDIRISRRGCLRVGGLTLGGFALPEILRAEAAAGARPTAKGVILVVLPGGPSLLDMYDLKPDAPAEVRGEFRPIGSRVPGIDICELLPRLARMTDRLTLIRSLVGKHVQIRVHGWVYRTSEGWIPKADRYQYQFSAPPPFVIFMCPQLWNRVKNDFLQRYPHLGVHQITPDGLHLAVGVRRA